MAVNVAKYMGQRLCYWEKAGDTAWKPAVEVACRWDDLVEEIMLAGGSKIVSKSYLITPFQLKQGSIVRLGTLADAKAQPWWSKVPTTLQGGYEVMISGMNPDRQGRPLLYTARL